MMQLSKYDLICLKSFGDLTIAARALNMLYEQDARNITLSIGSHHSDLYGALRPEFIVSRVIALKYPGVPAFYDIKDAGMLKAFSSLLDAFQARRRHKDEDCTLIFDAISWREKLLTRGQQAIGLSNSENNIYQNYRSTFLNLFGRVRDDVVSPGPGKTILILPHGRKSFRNIPPELIDCMAKKCIDKGFEPLVYALKGDSPIFCTVPRTIIAERSFSALREVIEQSHAVVSSDSLGAHLATYVGRPVFISSPYDKTRFWLPPNTASNEYWGLFSESMKMIGAFDRFLTDL